MKIRKVYEHNSITSGTRNGDFDGGSNQNQFEVYKKVVPAGEGLVRNPTGKYDYYIASAFGYPNIKKAYKEYKKIKKHGGEAIIVKIDRTQLSEDEIDMYLQSKKYNL